MNRFIYINENVLFHSRKKENDSFKKKMLIHPHTSVHNRFFMCNYK